ncbi:esterase C25G4.2-like isoform X1 [Durio zibethinus]|uniref:Esterase C25G4.2-like isoform X1 n=1 Tax=Durio zibethinus TaxID=66656 RepID=A0A6P5ZEA9_DURZI|nr:esterase C25G4.2-like isoform X1 [Durio zibethinus]
MLGSQMRRRKPRILCLHGFRTSGEILKKMMGKWPDAVLEKFDFDFPDAPSPAKGKSDIEGLYDPPYYEWYQVNKVECFNFEECIAYIEDHMIKHGPFDGLLGFSQGGMLASVLPWMQREGVAFTKVPKIKFVVVISGFALRELKSGPPKLLVNAFSAPVECPSLHMIGDKDFLKERGIKLLKSFVKPFVIHHSMGHTVPKLDEKGQKTMLKFIEKIQEMFSIDLQIALGPKAAL